MTIYFNWDYNDEKSLEGIREKETETKKKNLSGGRKKGGRIKIKRGNFECQE